LQIPRFARLLGIDSIALVQVVGHTHSIGCVLGKAHCSAGLPPCHQYLRGHGLLHIMIVQDPRRHGWVSESSVGALLRRQDRIRSTYVSGCSDHTSLVFVTPNSRFPEPKQLVFCSSKDGWTSWNRFLVSNSHDLAGAAQGSGLLSMGTMCFSWHTMRGCLDLIYFEYKALAIGVPMCHQRHHPFRTMHHDEPLW
jgi:hypothetical protein